jgi:zinc protease
MITQHKATLSNGLKILYLHTEHDPISACHLFLPTGAAYEPAEKSGITTLMWSLFTKGTTRRSARKLAEDIESMGASLGAGATHDYSEISCNAVAEYFIPTLTIMGEALFHCAFLPEEVEKEKKALIAGIQSKKESIFTMTNEHMNTHLYGDHPYARPGSGEEKTVNSLTAADLISWHDKVIVPHGAVLSIASNIAFDDLLPTLHSVFDTAQWNTKPTSGNGHLKEPSKLLKSKALTNPSHFEQAYLMMGFPAARVGSPDYIPLKVLNAVLGGGMSARLFQSLREKEGLAYDVGAYYPTKKSGSGFMIYMGLQESRLEEAKKRILHELDLIRDHKISDEELKQTVNYLKGTFILDHQTNGQRAHYRGWWEIMGLPSEFDMDYINALDRVTADDIFRIANATLNQPGITVETHPKGKLTAHEQ